MGMAEILLLVGEPLAARAAGSPPSPSPVGPSPAGEGRALDFDHARLDELENFILDELVPVHMPVRHTFTPFLYSREIFMAGPRDGRSGTLLTSRLHETTHQYVVLEGVALVLIPGSAPVRLTAGHVGVTEAGTRRGLYIEEDCRWITFHVLTPEEEALRTSGASEQDLVAAVEGRIIGRREHSGGRDVLGEYKAALAASGLPGVHNGLRSLEEGR